MNSPSNSDNLIDAVKKQMSKVQSLSEKEINAKIDSGKGMIEYFTKQTSEVETRRMKLADNNFTRISICLVVVGLVFNLELPPIITLLLVLALATLVVPSVAVLIEYNKQSKFRYPWNQDREGITNQWNWFYYGNPRLNEINYGTDVRFESENWIKYKGGLLYFIDRTIETTPPQELESILYQQYLLQAHNAFKNKFYLQLIDIESRWFVGMIKGVGFIAVFVLAYKILSTLIG